MPFQLGSRALSGADAFLAKPLGPGEVAHLWQFMKKRRLPEGSFKRDIESLRHLSLARSHMLRDRYDVRIGSPPNAKGVTHG